MKINEDCWTGYRTKQSQLSTHQTRLWHYSLTQRWLNINMRSWFLEQSTSRTFIPRTTGAKKQCFPDKRFIKITEASATTELQALLDYTSENYCILPQSGENLLRKQFKIFFSKPIEFHNLEQFISVLVLRIFVFINKLNSLLHQCWVVCFLWNQTRKGLWNRA